jgi:Tfp pilus assembly protein PilO
MQSLRTQIGWCTRMQWALACAILAGMVGFYALGYLPATRRMETLRLQIQSKKRELEQNQNKARNLPILALEVQQLESQVRTYDRQFPRQPELGQFIRDITQISQQLSLGEWKYQPGAPRRGNAFYELPIQMQFQGQFPNVEAFLRQVEDMQRLTRVRRIHIKGRSGMAGAVEVEMAMNIYFSEG